MSKKENKPDNVLIPFEVLKDVAYTGIDTGCGTSRLSQKSIDTARKIYERIKDTEKSNFVKHAKRELTEAGLFDKDSDYGGMIGKAVMKMIILFDTEGHSGASAGIVSGIFNVLADYGILTPLTEANADWQLINKPRDKKPQKDADKEYQSCKISKVFKKFDSITYSKAIVWVDVKDGRGFYGNIAGIDSTQRVKSLPFTPKTFRIEVEEIKGEFVIVDKTQLHKATKYYNMKF